MSYKAFLFILSQLAGKKKTRIVVEENVIFVDTSETKEQWTLSTKVYQGEGYIPPSVRACVSSRGTLQWQKGGAYLELDPESHSISLIEQFHVPQGKYIPFRVQFHDFLSVAAEWREIFDEQSENDSVPV